MRRDRGEGAVQVDLGGTDERTNRFDRGRIDAYLSCTGNDIGRPATRPARARVGHGRLWIVRAATARTLPAAGPGRAAVGDAATAADPIAGRGILTALVTGATAAQAVESDAVGEHSAGMRNGCGRSTRNTCTHAPCAIGPTTAGIPAFGSVAVALRPSGQSGRGRAGDVPVASARQRGVGRSG